jgi:hypothetical protein
LFLRKRFRSGISKPFFVGKKASQEYLEKSSTIFNQYRLFRREVGKGPEMSKKSLSPAFFALVIVDFGTALDLAFASAHEPHGRNAPVSVHPWFLAIIFTILVSG